MNIFLKAAIALCIGFAGMAGLQSFYVHSMMHRIRADAARPGASLPVSKPVSRFDGVKIGTPLIPKMGPIDTSAGQRAAIHSKAHEIYLMNRAAQNAVPKTPSIPGMRRF
jgi:hypothetical protein